MNWHGGLLPQTATRPGYLHFVDGWRAVAVIAIVAFHVGVPGTAAGYLGVDVFFVISGFLILGHLLRSLERGQFSAVEFLARRALRILPPLFLVLAATLLAALVFPVTPEDADEIVASGRWATLFAANNYFAGKVGYFDAAADERPLLHLWSLSVEEQFYVAVALVGVAAVFIQRRHRLPARGIALAAGGLALVTLLPLSIAATLKDPNHAFYLTPYRAWQFLLGGAAAFAVGRGMTTRPALVAWAGAALVAAALCLPLPGHAATALVTIGAALALAGCADEQNATLPRILSAGPMRLVGTLSYSWYLWHWPALFYMRSLDYGHARLGPDAAAALIALALAALTFYVAERPLQRLRAAKLATPGHLKILGAAAASILVMVAGATTLRAALVETDPVHEANRARRPASPLLTERDFTTGETGPPGAGRVLLFGDSFGESLVASAALATRDTGVGFAVLSNGACLPLFEIEHKVDRRKRARGCRKLRAAARRMIDQEPFHGVVLAASWPTYLAGGARPILSAAYDPLSEGAAKLADDIDVYAAKGMRVLILAPMPYFDVPAAACAFRARGLGVGEAKFACGKPRAAAEAELAPAREMIRRATEGKSGVRVLDAADTFCDHELCASLDGPSTFFHDRSHLNPRGAARLYEAHRADFDWVAGATTSVAEP